ncbi:MAG TPA: response regulator [Burkholderiales bacterium]
MANETILIVEDNDKNMKLARDVLQAKGYRTLEAVTAGEGVAAAAQKPDLVLMDIQLPDFSGIEALGKLRAEAATKDIPVIAFTASVMEHNRHQIMAAGFDAFISKPINLKEFFATIAATLAKRGGGTS